MKIKWFLSGDSFCKIKVAPKVKRFYLVKTFLPGEKVLPDKKVFTR